MFQEFTLKEQPAQELTAKMSNTICPKMLNHKRSFDFELLYLEGRISSLDSKLTDRCITPGKLPGTERFWVTLRPLGESFKGLAIHSRLVRPARFATNRRQVRTQGVKQTLRAGKPGASIVFGGIDE